MSQLQASAKRQSGRRQASAGIVLAAALTAAGCSKALPLGPTLSAQHHLASAVVLQVVRVKQSPPGGSCPAGSARLPKAAGQFAGSSGQCFRRIGKPLTIRSAAVTYIQQPAANQRPANHGLGIKVPAADNAALRGITTRAYHSRDQLAIIAAGKTWAVPNVLGPFTGSFEIPAQSAKQALQLQRILVPSA